MNNLINPFNLSESEIAKLPVLRRVRVMVFINDETVCGVEENNGDKRILTIPGGGIEEGEDDETGARREVREETGYEITELALLGKMKLIRKDHCSLTTFYTARIAGEQQALSLTEDEIIAKTKPVIISFNELIATTVRQYHETKLASLSRNLFIITEVLKKKLADEGFPYVYEWHDDAGTTYLEHFHKDNVSIYITEGDVTFTFPKTGETKIVSIGERFDVPTGEPHTALVGSSGCSYIVGEMIDGDS